MYTYLIHNILNMSKNPDAYSVKNIDINKVAKEVSKVMVTNQIQFLFVVTLVANVQRQRLYSSYQSIKNKELNISAKH